MLEVGTTFTRDDKTFCLVSFVNYSNQKYAIFMVEDDKLDYYYYLVNENEDGYDLERVMDQNTISNILEIFEKEEINS